MAQFCVAAEGGTGKEKGQRHPTIRGGVIVGAGAKILGNIVIGENCRIGSGSVVLCDIPDNSTVVGVPGRIVYKNGKRVIISDPRQTGDPLAEKIASLENLVRQLQREVEQLKAPAGSSPEHKSRRGKSIAAFRRLRA